MFPNQNFLSIQINILIDFNSSTAAIFSLNISTIEVAIDLYDQTALNKSIRIPIALDARRIAAKASSHFKGFNVGSLSNKNHVRKLKITLSEKNRYSYAIIETISAILLSNSRKLFILLGRGRSSFNWIIQLWIALSDVNMLGLNFCWMLFRGSNRISGGEFKNRSLWLQKINFVINQVGKDSNKCFADNSLAIHKNAPFVIPFYAKASLSTKNQ